MKSSLSVFYSSFSRALLYLIPIFTLIDYNYAYVESKPDEEDIQFDKLKQNHSTVEIYFMYTISLIALQIGTVCTLYIMLRTFLRWRRVELSLNMAHKLPFYMALS